MSESPASKRQYLEPEYVLPARALSRDGYGYSPPEDHWALVTDTGRLNFHFGDLGISADLVIGFKGFIAAKLRSENPRSVYAAYQNVRYLLISIAKYDQISSVISSAHLMNYRASLQPEHLYRSTDVNDVVRAWARLGTPGIGKDAFATATEMPRYKRPRALAVRLRSPTHGAYSNLEFDGLYKALHAAFAAGEISIDNYGLCLLSGTVSPRPVQLASLWVCDLKVDLGPIGKTYRLRIPRAKQRGGGYRAEFTERPLVEEIGMVIETQARIVRERARNCGMENPDEAPLFPAVHVSSTFYEGELVPARPTHASIAMRIINVMEGLAVKSERTGEPINVNATRARRTTGTRAAQEGKSLEEIAAILDHSSVTAAQSYIEIRSELLQNLDKKIAMLLAPMAQRFSGAITPRHDDSAHGIHRHVFGSISEQGGPTDIGGCGKQGFCGLGKPIACYTCRLFHPWLDGPHEAMLDSLLARRRSMSLNGSLIVATTLDETIIACAEVVRQCAAQTTTLESDSNG